MATELGRMVTYLDGLLPIKTHYRLITWSWRPCDKLKLYLHYHSAYDHQTGQDGNLPWWAPAHKVTRPFNQVVLLDHVKT